jgi:hypothetical protein
MNLGGAGFPAPPSLIDGREAAARSGEHRAARLAPNLCGAAPVSSAAPSP